MNALLKLVLKIIVYNWTRWQIWSSRVIDGYEGYEAGCEGDVAGPTVIVDSNTWYKE